MSTPAPRAGRSGAEAGRHRAGGGPAAGAPGRGSVFPTAGAPGRAGPGGLPGAGRADPDGLPAAEAAGLSEFPTAGGIPPGPAEPGEPGGPGRGAGPGGGAEGPSVVRSSGVMALGTIASRGTGFLRTLVLAYALGVGSVSIAYNTPTPCRTPSTT